MSVKRTPLREAVNAHFLRLVRRGLSPAASGGEHSARRLAQAVYDDATRLDATARAGLHAWIDWCCAYPCEARDFLEDGNDE